MLYLYTVAFTSEDGPDHSSLTVNKGNVNESSVVQHSLVSTASWALWLLGLLDLWSLGLDLTSTS